MCLIPYCCVVCKTEKKTRGFSCIVNFELALQPPLDISTIIITLNFVVMPSRTQICPLLSLYVCKGIQHQQNSPALSTSISHFTSFSFFPFATLIIFFVFIYIDGVVFWVTTTFNSVGFKSNALQKFSLMFSVFFPYSEIRKQNR